MQPRKLMRRLTRPSRCFTRGREFATAKEFSEHLREDELVRIHQWGL